MSKELDALAVEAGEVDGLIAPVVTDVSPPLDTEDAPPAPIVDRMAEAVMLLGILRPMATMALPCIKDAPDTEWQVLQQPIADLLAFYNVDVTKYLASPWVALAFAASPLVMRGIDNWQSEPEKKPDQPGAEPDKMPASVATAPKVEPRA